MERVRVVVFGCLLALGFLFCPSAAYASDGFLGGLQDLTGTREVEEQRGYEVTYLEDYHPILRTDDGEGTEIEEGSEISSVIDSATQIPFAGGLYLGLIDFLGWFFYGPSGPKMVAFAAGLVFLFWGVRKSVRMFMSAFRKGSASV